MIVKNVKTCNIVLIIFFLEMKNIFSIILKPNFLLHQLSSKVIDISNTLKELAKKLTFTIKYNNAIGIASVQIGELQKIIIIDCVTLKKGFLLKNFRVRNIILVNTEIKLRSNNLLTYNEGCLSFDSINIDYYYNVSRYRYIKLKYFTLKKEAKYLISKDHLFTACIQHEIDHTNGVLFTDKLLSLKIRISSKIKYSLPDKF